jgi:hypothetical protein
MRHELARECVTNWRANAPTRITTLIDAYNICICIYIYNLASHELARTRARNRRAAQQVDAECASGRPKLNVL